MMRVILAGAAIYCLLAGGAQARSIPEAGMTAEEVLAFVKGAGLEAKIEKTDEGEPYIATSKDGVNFDLDLYDCEKARCRAVQFVASFELKTPLTAEQVNTWNLQKRYVRAYTNKGGDVLFAYDANVAPGGTSEALQDDLDIFLQFIPEILEHIGW